ncbi:hypothetical protein IWX49DRAFT_585215 [Phyllosticta citricarpa]|uniref:Uncharacterized protein n=1 Tax=Phyllosticta paracitricarpa TaxID=2016321 RepID=A0ABR1NDL8_9PEZI
MNTLFRANDFFLSTTEHLLISQYLAPNQLPQPFYPLQHRPVSPSSTTSHPPSIPAQPSLPLPLPLPLPPQPPHPEQNQLTHSLTSPASLPPSLPILGPHHQMNERRPPRQSTPRAHSLTHLHRTCPPYHTQTNSPRRSPLPPPRPFLNPASRARPQPGR